VFSVIAIGFAGRGCECYDMDFDQVTRCQSKDGNAIYNISFQRTKTLGACSDIQSLPINGNIEVNLIDEYINCFPVDLRQGRFFRKLHFVSGKIQSTQQVIGEKTAALYGKKVAALLGLTTPDSYTGHTWRRTATTWAADEGLTLPQLKVLTGHKSDTVLQGYIDTSKVMKNLVSSAVSLEPAPQSSSSSSQEPPQKKSRTIGEVPQFQNVTISIAKFTGDFSAFNGLVASSVSSSVQQIHKTIE
jgi:hypothetical protein